MCPFVLWGGQSLSEVALRARQPVGRSGPASAFFIQPHIFVFCIFRKLFGIRFNCKTKNSRANSWKRSHKILIIVPSAQVHIVDGGHFSLDTAPDEIAARVREFMDMPKESIPGEEIMATATTPARPPFPPFTRDSAMQKVRLAEDGWNTRDPGKVALAYAIDSRWRNRSEFINGRNEIIAFLSRKWAKELEYRLIKELWAFTGNRIAVRFAYE